MIEQMRKLFIAMDDQLIAATAHYTLLMGRGQDCGPGL
jgi:hypothetical protein